MADTTVAGTTGLRSYEAYQDELRTPNKDLGKNEFLQLLAAQLQYQDPLEPMKDSDFVAQLAQFSSLQQMENLNAAIANMQFYNFAGKFVYAEVPIDGVLTPVAGVVDSVFMSNGEAWLQVGDVSFKASLVSEVFDKDSIYADNPLLDSATLIGRQVKANYLDGKETKEFTGEVTRIHIKDGAMVADILAADGTVKTLPVANIIDIASKDAPETPKDPAPAEGESGAQTV